MASANNALIAALNASIELSISNQTVTLRDEIQELTNKTEAQASKIKAQDAKLNQQDLKIKQLDEKVAGLLEEARTQQQSEFTESLQSLQTEINGVEDQVTQVDGLLNDHLVECGESSSEIMALHTRVTALEARPANTSKIRSESSTSKSEINELRSKVAIVEDQVAQLTDIIRRVEVDFAILENASKILSPDVPATDSAEFSAHIDLLTRTKEVFQAMDTVPEPQAPAHGVIQQPGLKNKAPAKPSAVDGLGDRDATPFPLRTTRRSTRNKLGKTVFTPYDPRIVELSPSRLRRSESSDATLMPDTPRRLRMEAQRVQAAASPQSHKERLGLAPAVIYTIHEEDEDLDSTTEDGQMADDANANTPTPSEEAEEGQRVTNAATIKNDEQITRLDRDLYRQDWYAADKPGKLDDFVRMKRAETRANEDVRKPREMTPVNYAKVLLPKLRSKKMPNSKRSRDADGQTEEDSQVAARQFSKKAKVAVADGERRDGVLQHHQKPMMRTERQG